MRRCSPWYILFPCQARPASIPPAASCGPVSQTQRWNETGKENRTNNRKQIVSPQDGKAGKRAPGITTAVKIYTTPFVFSMVCYSRPVLLPSLCVWMINLIVVCRILFVFFPLLYARFPIYFLVSSFRSVNDWGVPSVVIAICISPAASPIASSSLLGGLFKLMIFTWITLAIEQ